MSLYVLKSKNEATRLDQQVTLENYDLAREFEHIHFDQNSKVLDAGCGSGVLTRFIELNYPATRVQGCDLDENSLSHARANKLRVKTDFYSHDIINDSLPETYDVIINRLVAHHLGEEACKRVFKHFYDGLNTGGKVYVIDPDGVFYNIGTDDTKLKAQIEKLMSQYQGDTMVARKIPSILHRVGFKDIGYHIQQMNFTGEQKLQEIEQWSQRLESMIDFLIMALGSENEARDFIASYTHELQKSYVPLFYNKFIVWGSK